MDVRTVAFVGPSNLGPYHLARYRHLALQGVRLHVVCCPMPEFDRPWTFEAENADFEVDFPFDGSPPGTPLRELLGAAQQYLDRFRPEVVVSIGYNSKFLWAMAWAARRRDIPVILNLIGWRGARPRRWWKELAKRQVCKRLFDAALVPGRRSADYARTLGIAPDRVFMAGNAIDNAHFASVRAKVPATPRFVYVGRLAPGKNLPRLLSAYARYRDSGGHWQLAIVGDGPLASEIDSLAGEGVELMGWAAYDRLPDLLASSTALVLPSVTESWGLVVNEAMAAGLPVLVSTSCGCHPELCHDGVNGFGIDPSDTTSIVTAMSRISALSAQVLSSMSSASTSIISNYSLESWSAGLRTAIDALESR